MVKDKEDVMTDNNRKGDEFVQALQRFHAGLPAEHQAMLDSIIGAATQDDDSAGYAFRRRTEDAPTADQDETSGYGNKWPRTEDAPTADQDDTAGYGLGGIRGIQRNESDQDADDTSGYKLKAGRTEDAPSTTGTDSNDRWAKLVEWLNQADDDTSGYGRAV
jgi:hypothetical protein